jgi:hypothetical protein
LAVAALLVALNDGACFAADLAAVLSGSRFPKKLAPGLNVGLGHLIPRHRVLQSLDIQGCAGRHRHDAWRNIMLTATSESAPLKGLGDALERLLRPAVGFHHPRDVLKDPILRLHEKRAILSSWASDACAVPDHPGLRWFIGAEQPVDVDEVLEALVRLDRVESRGRRKAASLGGTPGDG